jgi:hypothetical protein
MVEIAVLPHGRAAGVDEATEFTAELVVVKVLEIGVDAGRRIVVAPHVELQNQDVSEAAGTLLTP